MPYQQSLRLIRHCGAASLLRSAKNRFLRLSSGVGAFQATFLPRYSGNLRRYLMAGFAIILHCMQPGCRPYTVWTPHVA